MLNYIILLVSILLTPLMVVSGLIFIIFFIILSFILGKNKSSNIIENYFNKLWIIPLSIGYLWYYNLRKVLVPCNEGIFIESNYRKRQLIKWQNITSIGKIPYGMRVWVINYGIDKSTVITDDFLPQIIHAAKSNGIVIKDEYYIDLSIK